VPDGLSADSGGDVLHPTAYAPSERPTAISDAKKGVCRNGNVYSASSWRLTDFAAPINDADA